LNDLQLNSTVLGTLYFKALKMSLVSSALFVAEQSRLMGPVFGPLFFTAFLSIWVVICLPCTVVEMVPGFLFGIKTGWMVSTVGKSIGSAISLYLGRYVFKEATEKFVFARYPILRKLGIAAEREGFPFLLFIRGMWLPIALKNYGLAVLNVPIRDVLLAGFLTSIPHSLLWAWLGSEMNSLAEVVQGSGKISLSDVIPGRDIVFIAAPIIVLSLIVARNFYNRFAALLQEDD
jgi:uncharacterized membrane protein YdjX (TVP38/TMEM64 family)